MSSLFAALAVLWFGFTASAGAALVVGGANNRVVAAYNVNVGGALYDVTLQYGSCLGIFIPCDASKFTFTTEAYALAAAQALGSQVFIDDGAGRMFDSVSQNLVGDDVVLPDPYIVPFALGPSDFTGEVGVKFAWFYNYRAGGPADATFTETFDSLRVDVAQHFALFTPRAVPLVLNVDAGGQLIGASGVRIGDLYYNVSFQYGSCNGLFAPCDANQFTFTTEDSALAAARALDSQAFIDVGAGRMFDSVSRNLIGDDVVLPDPYIVPFALGPSDFTGEVGVKFAWFYNYRAGGPADATFTETFDSLRVDVAQHFAVFSVQSTTVPEPSTMALVALAMLGLLHVRRKAPGH